MLAAEGDADGPLPIPGGASGSDGGVVEVPRDHAELRRRDPVLAARWREATAQTLEACFRAGSIAASFDRTRSAYALVPGANG